LNNPGHCAGEVLTWGNGKHGQLGILLPTGLPLPTTSFPTVVPGLPRITAVAAGRQFTVALSAVGTVYAWGRNDRGQCGSPGSRRYPVPVRVARLPESIVQIAAGAAHAVALSASGCVYAWGEGIALPQGTAVSLSTTVSPLSSSSLSPAATEAPTGPSTVSSTASKASASALPSPAGSPSSTAAQRPRTAPVGARRSSTASVASSVAGSTQSSAMGASLSGPPGQGRHHRQRRTVVRPEPVLLDLAGVRIVRISAGWDGTIAMLTEYALTGTTFVAPELCAPPGAWAAAAAAVAASGSRSGGALARCGSTTALGAVEAMSPASRRLMERERTRHLKAILDRRTATRGGQVVGPGLGAAAPAGIGGHLVVAREVSHTAVTGSAPNYVDIDLGGPQRIECLEITAFDGASGFCIATTMARLPMQQQQQQAAGGSGGDGDDDGVPWLYTTVIPPVDKPPALLGAASSAVENLPQRIALQVLAQQGDDGQHSARSGAGSAGIGGLDAPSTPQLRADSVFLFLFFVCSIFCFGFSNLEIVKKWKLNFDAKF
jgi:hypothetical protein